MRFVSQMILMRHDDDCTNGMLNVILQFSNYTYPPPSPPSPPVYPPPPAGRRRELLEDEVPGTDSGHHRSSHSLWNSGSAHIGSGSVGSDEGRQWTFPTGGATTVEDLESDSVYDEAAYSDPDLDPVGSRLQTRNLLQQQVESGPDMIPGVALAPVLSLCLSLCCRSVSMLSLKSISSSLSHMSDLTTMAPLPALSLTHMAPLPALRQPLQVNVQGTQPVLSTTSLLSDLWVLDLR